jgi:hypothetical protein
VRWLNLDEIHAKAATLLSIRASGGRKALTPGT